MFRSIECLANFCFKLQAILARNTDLTPTPEEQTNIINMVSKVQIVLENMTLNPGSFDACVSCLSFNYN